MGGLFAWLKEHWVLTLAMGGGVVASYYIYQNYSSSASSTATTATDPNAALLAALEAAGSNQVGAQTVAGLPSGSEPQSLTDTIPQVTTVPSATSSGAGTTPLTYTSPTINNTTPSPAATVPSYYASSAPSASDYTAAQLAAFSGQPQTTGQAILDQQAAIYDPNNPFIINNPALAQGADQNAVNALETYCANTGDQSACSAQNLAEAGNITGLAAQLANPGTTESTSETGTAGSAGTTPAQTYNPVTGGQRIAGAINSGALTLTPLQSAPSTVAPSRGLTPNIPALTPSTNIPATGTTPAQPVSLPPTVAPARGLTPNLPALGAQSGNVITARTGTFLSTPLPSVNFGNNLAGFNNELPESML